MAKILLLAVALSMDAFAVAVCKGLSLQRAGSKEMVTVGAWFGIFQGVMPLCGFWLAGLFVGRVMAYGHFIACGLLALVGINMLREAFDKTEAGCDASLAPGGMLVLAVATSIDALAAGVTLAFDEHVPMAAVAAIIALTTFLLSMAGVKIGGVFGSKYKRYATLLGGCILIFLGGWTLFEGLGIV
ncbi:MAG: manganese efflux pump MntP family protein [Eubacteriales bacterium]